MANFEAWLSPQGELIKGKFKPFHETVAAGIIARKYSLACSDEALAYLQETGFPPEKTCTDFLHERMGYARLVKRGTEYKWVLPRMVTQDQSARIDEWCAEQCISWQKAIAI